MISNKCYYALRAMLELAKHEGSGPVTIGQIAQAQHIPARFLEAILRQLKHAGFTDSIRGKEGGYSLAKPAKQISVGEILELVEGPLVNVNPNLQEEHTRRATGEDVFEMVWNKAQHALSSVLNDISFAQLVEHENELLKSYVADYSI